jgi:hypothetical protein
MDDRLPRFIYTQGYGELVALGRNLAEVPRDLNAGVPGHVGDICLG